MSTNGISPPKEVVESPRVYGGGFCPASVENGQWSEEHRTYVVWMGCYQTPEGDLMPKIGTCGVLGGALPCSFFPLDPSDFPWCPEGMHEAPNQWGGRGCEPD